jgi:hypothetical protein
MRILAIDPGNENSAFAVYEDGNILRIGGGMNERGLLADILAGEFKDCDILAIEMVASYGMAVGKTVFETCVWIGRFIQAWDGDYAFIYRKDVKMHLCNSMRAKDANVRQAVMDRYGSDKKKAVGTKKNPGPLYGVSKDMWSALAVAITAAELPKQYERKLK